MEKSGKQMEGGAAERAFNPMPDRFEDEENLYRLVMTMLTFGNAKEVDTVMYNKLVNNESLSKAVFKNPKSPDDPHTQDITLMHLAC